MHEVKNGQFASWSKDEKLEGVSFSVHLLYLQIFITKVMACWKCHRGYNNNYYYYDYDADYYYLLQLGCYLVAVVILHVNKT